MLAGFSVDTGRICGKILRYQNRIDVDDDDVEWGVEDLRWEEYVETSLKHADLITVNKS